MWGTYLAITNAIEVLRDGGGVAGVGVEEAGHGVGVAVSGTECVAGAVVGDGCLVCQA